MAVKAPKVTSLAISKLSANNVELRWDDVGSNFYYLVEIAETRTTPVPIWQGLGYVSTNGWFGSDLQPLTYYKMRVAVTAAGFEQSDWVETEEFQTFEINAYTFDLMTEMTLANKFIQEKFIKNNQEYVDFNSDGIYAALMGENFTWSNAYEHISSIDDYIIKEDEYHEIQGSIEKVCKELDRVYLMEDHGVLYLFERYQDTVKVSNDKGQTWKAVRLLNDRVGYPLSKTVFYQTTSTSYVLGYDRIFYGRMSTDVRWSSDEVRFSSQDITFAKLGDTLGLGYDVNIFGTYARLPGELSHIAEAITANDDYIYVAARDVVRFAKAKNAPLDTDPLSPTFGERVFDTRVSRITGNPKAVTWKMDSVQGKVFALVVGEVKAEKQDPRVLTNIVDSASKGVYMLNDDEVTWTRVFGNTAEERRRIEVGYTNMSTDGNEIFISSSNFKSIEETIIPDTELPEKYPDTVTSAVKVAAPHQYVHDKHQLMMSFRSDSNKEWKNWVPGRMKYYAEPFFNKCTRSNTRCWIDTSWRIVMTYSDIHHVLPVDIRAPTSPDRYVKETWVNGTCTVRLPNIEFNSFTRYASGVLFYTGTGEIISYYEFNYRVKDNVRIVWKPIEVFLRAYLQNQTREEPWVPEPDKNLPDPDLRPLLNTMMPDSYLLEDTNFEKFCEYYIQYISSGYGSHYNNLLNLIKNKFPLEQHSWEYLWSEIYKRNIYLDKDKRDAVSRFFEARKNDFYSTKGIEASYKFLFKVLYNEEVEIDIESNSGLEYDIIVESDNITEDLAGRTVYTSTGRCNVTYIERNYSKGKLQWRLTIHNLLGRLIVGQVIKSEKTSFEGMVVQGVRGKELASDSIEYINRSRSYYIMKIKSALPTSRYRDDVLRFVHPVGFGFVGITLLTMFINAGLNMKHVETTINKLKTYKWDSGLPSEWYDRVAVLSSDESSIEKDPLTGEPIYVPFSKAGQPFPVRPGYDAENNNSILWGLTPSQRRRPMSPLFDQSAVTFAQYRNLVDQRLKDDIGLPRDPEVPTQVKVNA